LNSSGKREEARPFFDKACESPHDDLRIDALHMVAIVSDPEDALKFNEQAIAEANASSNPNARRWLGSLLNNTAWSYHNLGRPQRALELFVDALKFRQVQGDPEPIRIAKWCIARCLRTLGRTEEALAGQLDLAAESDDGFVQEELGECLLALGRASESRAHFARAYEKLKEDPWLSTNEPERIARLQELSHEDA
jgi:tetratricopeptide (TPR) repeat protein